MLALVSQLLRLAAPVALARLGIMTMGLCDAMVIGQLAPKELPHQALGWAPTSVLLVTAIGLLMGVQVLSARAIGAGDPEHAGGALQRGLVVSLVASALAVLFAVTLSEDVFRAFGIAEELVVPSARIMRVLVFSVPFHLCYVSAAFFVEAIQRPLLSTWTMWAANLVNLLLNLWWVPEHGAIGSAWATVGARGFLALSLLLWVWFSPEAVRYGVRKPSPRPSYREFFAVGFAAAVSQAAEAGAFSGMTILAGRLGAQAVASYQISLNLMAIVFMCALGMATATAVLTSEAHGRAQPRDVARASWAGLGVNSALMLGISLSVVLFADVIARAYTSDLALAGLVAALMPLVAATMVPDGGQSVAASALRARGDNWFPTASHLLAYALVMPVLGFQLAEVGARGVRGLLEAILLASVLSVSVLIARMWYLTQRRRLV